VTGRPDIDPEALARRVEAVFPEAAGVWLHGSVADGTARPDSDVDIAILPDRRIDPLDLLGRAQEVAAGLGREVDLVDLWRVSTVLRFEVVTGGRRIAARDPFACDRFETATIGMYQDLLIEVREHLAERAS
jgi:predicted nucleotidyltransferase